MPSGNGLPVANGLAQGIDSFIKNFIQVSQMKNQEKLTKNSHIEQVLLSQIQDPNTSYYQRAKMIDAIGTLYKTEKPLSHLLGYDKLNEQDFLDPNKPAHDEPTNYGKQAATQGSTISNLEQAYQQADPNYVNKTPISTEVPQGLTKRGNLSPNDITFQQRKSLQQTQDISELDKAKKLAQINFDLQERSYKANGYKITSEGTDKDGNYVQILTNNSGDTKVNKLPAGFKPLKLSIAETSANKPSATLANLEAGYLGKINPSTGVNYTEAEANAAAAKDFADHYQASTDYLKLGGVQKTQSTTGTTPKSPSQIADDERADTQNQIALQKAYDDIEAQAIQSSADAKESADNAHNHYIDIVAPLKNERDKWLAENGGARADTTDTDYKALDDRYRAAQNQYNTLKTRADAADAKDKGLKTKLESARKRLERNSNNGNNTPIKKVSTNSSFSPRMKAQIAAVRKANPGSEKLSDAEIAAQITAAGFK